MNEINSPHWEIKAHYPLHSGLSVGIFFNNQTQERAHGWLTAQNELYIGAFSTIPPILQTSYVSAFSSFFQQLTETILARQTDFQTLISTPPCAILRQLPKEICFELLHYWCMIALKTPYVIKACALSPHSAQQNSQLINHIKPFNIAPLQAILRFRTQQKSLPTLLSPFPPGLMVKAQHHILAKDFICYRFQDPLQKEAFYLIWSDNQDPATSQPLFYAPSQNLLIGHPLGIASIAANILTWLLHFPVPKNFNTTTSDVNIDDYGIGKISYFSKMSAKNPFPSSLSSAFSLSSLLPSPLSSYHNETSDV